MISLNSGSQIWQPGSIRSADASCIWGERERQRGWKGMRVMTSLTHIGLSRIIPRSTRIQDLSHRPSIICYYQSLTLLVWLVPMVPCVCLWDDFGTKWPLTQIFGTVVHPDPCRSSMKVKVIGENSVPRRKMLLKWSEWPTSSCSGCTRNTFTIDTETLQWNVVVQWTHFTETIRRCQAN